MIQKKYRLTERQVKKVLHKGKPFFSYTVVLNSIPNREKTARFAVVIGGKSVKNSVHRNVFRRLFYDTVHPFLQKYSKDFVFVVKSKTKLDANEKKVRDNFKNDILFLLNKHL